MTAPNGRLSPAALTTIAVGLLATVFTGVFTWLWKLDERQYMAQAVFATKGDLAATEGRIREEIRRLARVLERPE